MKTYNRILIAAVLLLTVSSSAFAADPILPGKAGYPNPGNTIELKFTGMVNNNPMYHLKINGSELNGSYNISITDKYGVTLYTENIAKGNFSKTFLFDRDDLGNQPLKMEIINKKDKRSVVYEINSDTRTYTENTVTRIF